MTKKTKQSGKSKTKKPATSLRIGTIIIAGLCFLTAGLLLRSAGLGPAHQTGQLDENQTSSGENLYRSLDLRLAKKASYPSSAITLVKDLGASAGLKRQIISFKVPDDNLTEYGLMYLPSGTMPAGGWPVIILCHGYINPSEYVTTLGYISDMDFYAQNGFAVIKPDFRGQGLSSGQGLPEGAYYSMAYNTDIMSLISAVKDTDYFNSKNINLWGHSMGAYIALRASVISKDIKNTVLLSGPVGSLNQIYLSYLPPSDENNPYALKDRNAAFAKYGTPGENSRFWQNASPTSFLGTTAVNYQIHAGLLDPLVPPQLSADLDNDLSSLQRSHEYYTYDNGRHGLIEQRQLIWSRSLALYKKS